MWTAFTLQLIGQKVGGISGMQPFSQLVLGLLFFEPFSFFMLRGLSSYISQRLLSKTTKGSIVDS